MSRLLRLILLTTLLTLAGATAAAASPSQSLIFDAQRDLIDPSTRDRALAELESLGVDQVRVLLYWNEVAPRRSEEHTSELQSRQYLVCRLLLEKKKKKK